MGWFVDKLKVNAAAASMHQFLPAVRTIYPLPPNDAAVEAAAVFLYTNVAYDVFGNRFVARMRELLRERYKFSSALEIDLLVQRIDARYQALMRSNGQVGSNGYDAYTHHVHCAIRALLIETAGHRDDPEQVKWIFPRFEEAVRRLKAHLTGIRHQTGYVMKRS
jgi:hypothetical protein